MGASSTTCRYSAQSTGFRRNQERWQDSGLPSEIIETIQRLGRAHDGLQGVNDILAAEQYRCALAKDGWQCDSLSEDTLGSLYNSHVP